MSKSYGRTWRSHGCIIRRRQTSFQVELFHCGKRQRIACPDEESAERQAKQWADEAKSDGDTALSLTKADRQEAVELLRLLATEADLLDVKSAVALLRSGGAGVNLTKPQPSPLAEAVRFWLRHHPEGATPPTVAATLVAYLEKKTNRRPATLREYRDKIGRFQRAFPTATVADITAADIDRWLTKTVSHHASRRQYLAVLHGFFKFACRTWRLESNPVEGVYMDAGETDQTDVEAYTVKEAEDIMDAAAKHEHAARIVPMLAIGFFAGLRPTEIEGMEWSNVSLEQKQMRVTPATAKRRRQRFVEISDNLAAWLTPYAQSTGLIAPAVITYRRDRDAVMKASGAKRWIRDGLRHSFGTYHLAAYGDANKTALQMGHRGNTDLVFQHYRKLVTQDEGLAFWKINPKFVYTN